MKRYFKNLNLNDGTGKEVSKEAYIKVEDGIIKEIGNGSNVKFEESSQIVDLDGAYVMPGLIDCHTHITLPGTANPGPVMMTSNRTDMTIMAMKHLEKFLENGVTYIRDVGDVDHIGLELKKHLMNGDVKGPGIHSAGLAITMTGGHIHQIGSEADGVEEVRKATRKELKAGADVIKVVASGGVTTPGGDVNSYQFNVDELKAAVLEAHKAGRKVCAHCHGNQAIKNAITAGIDSIEHATLLDEEAVEMLVNSGSYIVPTLGAVENIVINGEAGGIPKFMVEKASQMAKQHKKSFQMAYQAGVKIAMGTDAGTSLNAHGVNSPIELERMVKAGMKPMDAIVAASKTASELIGIEEQYGTLEPGKFADFLVLSENPLDNIKTVQNVKSVYQKGKLV